MCPSTAIQSSQTAGPAWSTCHVSKDWPLLPALCFLLFSNFQLSLQNLVSSVVKLILCLCLFFFFYLPFSPFCFCLLFCFVAVVFLRLKALLFFSLLMSSLAALPVGKVVSFLAVLSGSGHFTLPQTHQKETSGHGVLIGSNHVHERPGCPEQV